MTRSWRTFFSAFLTLASISGILLAKAVPLTPAKDVNLQSAGAPYAPLDVSKRSDPTVPLSKSQRQELLGEFKGLVHMGLRKAAYEEWEGKDMADCDKPANSQERWTYRCEIITGQGNGYYYFYPGESRRSALLLRLDIRIDGADERLLDDFRVPIQQLFGKGTLVETPAANAAPTGPVRRWDTGNDVVELFIDRAVRPGGSVRFVWTRAPLAAGQ